MTAPSHFLSPLISDPRSRFALAVRASATACAACSPVCTEQIHSLFGLAPCGVCPARDIAAAAVRSYRTFSPLPRACEAVRFLWHFPSTSLDAGFPDVIRHTALRSSDFPPSSLAVTRAAVRSSCCKLIIIDYEWLRTNRSPMAGSMPGWFAEWPGESNHPWVVHQRTTSGRQGRR